MVRLLTNDDVATGVSMPAIIESLEDLYRGLGEGTAFTRPRTDVHSPAATDGEFYRFKTMGGIVPSAGVYALRINSDVLRWVERDGDTIQEKLPRAEGDRYVGLVLLFDAGDGTPLAVMPDGYVQRLRVGGTTAIGAKYLARDDVSTFGLLGAGWQADGQVAAMTEVFDLDQIRVYSPTPESRESFAETAQLEYQVPVDAVDDPDHVFEADVVHAATNSRSPVFDVDQLRPGQHLGAINRMEIDPDAPAWCDVTVVHSKTGKGANYWTADVDTDDVPYLGGDTGRTWEAYPDLGELVTGQVPGRTSDDQVTFFFNNIGIGAQFAAVGAIAYRAAVEAGVGEELATDRFTQELVP
jgi:ornithine cyclodeaminase/alanine dehydrogenase-like protein (mu-crystallin family)